MPETTDKKIKEAKHLLNSFAERTGISENEESSKSVTCGQMPLRFRLFSDYHTSSMMKCITVRH